MKNALALLCLTFLLAFSSSASADWFLSAETKALIAKAETGETDAQFRVGTAYDFGKGAPRDSSEAMKWYRMAAERGHVEAQNSLGSILQADKRYADALPWYEKAAAQGHALATNSLAYLYDLGLGVPQDRKKGFELYSKAAEFGWAEAMWNLANMYGAGQIGQPDILMACVWSVKARRYAAPNDKQLLSHVARVMPQLERMLSEEQLASCKRQAESWSPSPASKTEQR